MFYVQCCSIVSILDKEILESRNKMNKRQTINKILHDHLDVNRHEDYTNYKKLITAIEEWHESEVKKLSVQNVAGQNEQLDTLKKRLDSVGIDIEFAFNYPWIYIWKINGKRVKETFEGDHGFTVGFLPVRRDKPFHFTDLSEIFKLIRRYCK